MFQVTEWLGLIEFAVDDNLTKIFSLLNNESPDSEWIKAMKDLDEVFQFYCSFGYLCYDYDNTSLFPRKRWTMLHHMAYHNAPFHVVEKYSQYDVCVGLKDEEGKIALDYVANDASEEYKKLFVPQYKYENIDVAKVNKLEMQFHKFMLERLEDFNYKKEKLVLPQLLTYLEKQCSDAIHIEIPGMLGGFNTTFLLSDANEITGLNSYSLSRVCGGSDKEHVITENGWEFIKGGDYR